MSRLFLVFALAAVSNLASCIPTTPAPPPTIWALLVAGSNGYYNYRHQADICHAYQILHNNGIPDSNIIVMMYDDIANNTDNPTPGIIINHPGGPNVYKGVPKDYTGDDVNSDNFLNILSGKKSELAGIGSEKVINSGPNDIVFVNFVDHGGPGTLYFPNDELMADRLMKTVSHMSATNRFNKLIVYVEACHAGSMFDSILPDTTNVFVLTASDPFESSYACYYDEKRGTYLGDVFSIMWMNDTEHESLPEESLHHQFERVRSATNTSHVEEYGDLDIGSTKLSKVIGFNTRFSGSFRSLIPSNHRMDVADNMDVPYIVLDKRIKKETDPMKKRVLKLRKHSLMKRRSIVDSLFNEMVAKAAHYNNGKMNELKSSNYGLNWDNMRCYKDLIAAVKKLCVDPVKSPYARAHLQKLINMCTVPWMTTKKAISVIHQVCPPGTSPVKHISVH